MALKKILYLLFILTCFVFKISASYRGSNSARIPSNVKMVSQGHKDKSELDKEAMQKALLSQRDGLLPEELDDLSDKHVTLYLRARSYDYDFAQIGDKCDQLTVDEIREFLNIIQEIEPKRGELGRRKSPKEKGDFLEKLFNHSKPICDFRNLLTCHKSQYTCGCPHISMGIDRRGICAVNLGHACELSPQRLEGLGVLMNDKTNKLQCLHENSVCAPENQDEFQIGAGVSPNRKICKCQNGFGGATCSRAIPKKSNFITRSKQSFDQDVGRKYKDKDQSVSESESNPLGRGFWDHEGGEAFSQYNLHPEQIKAKLISLMQEQGGFGSAQEQEETANSLIKEFEIDEDKEEMVIHELMLRDMATLKHGDNCNPTIQMLLDNPPIEVDSSGRWVDPRPEDITAWHLGILHEKSPFCNIYKNFRCDEKTSTCQCRTGLALDPSNSNTCSIPLGYNCGLDFDSTLHFDPLGNEKKFTDMKTPSCMSRTVCRYHPLFFEKKCWCEEGLNCEDIFNEKNLQNMVRAIKSRFNLNLGESCDPDIHKEMLSYSSSSRSENPGHERRLELIREILSNPETRLCDIESYLNCSETSRKCECWSQLHPNSKIGANGIEEESCQALNLASCGRTFQYGIFMYPNKGSQIWEVERTFQKEFMPDCGPGAMCAGGNNQVWAGRCVCLDKSKTGESCTDSKSILGSGFKARQIPNDADEEMAMIHIYFDLNRQTHLLEQFMTLQHNDDCDPAIGLSLERLVRFWKDVSSSNDTRAAKRSLKAFTAATKLTKYLVNTDLSKSAALCNVTLGLRCLFSSKKCKCPAGSRWIGNRCYLDVDEVCDPTPGADWISTCMNTTKCVLHNRKRRIYRCKECPQKARYCGEEDRYDNQYENPWQMFDKPQIQGRGADFADTSAGGAKDEEEEDRSYFVLRQEPSGRVGGTQGTEPSVVPILPSTAKPAPSTPSPHQIDSFLKEIEEMLEEIMTYRKLPYGEPCAVDEEKSLDQIFPILPVYDLNEIPPSNVFIVYSSLSKLYWFGMSFCDRKKYLKCSAVGKCICSEQFGLVEEDGECRLTEHKYCTIINEQTPTSVLQREYPPLFKCQKGTTCTKLDYGMSVCFPDE